MKANKGFTLIEIAVVLAIIAILAAILTPIVTSYIDQARTTRANSDTKKIAESVLLYKRDTGLFPGYDLLSGARAGGAVDKKCLLTGTSSALSAVPTGWAGNCTTVGLLESYLNINSIGVPNSSPANNTGGNTQFRGPYLDGIKGTDPWGSPYVVNSEWLTNTFTNHSFAVSAGPDSNVDTVYTQGASSGFTTGNDDIGALIR